MKEIGVEDLKRIQLEILSVVAEFCEKNGIRYWIDNGTLLGAVRHGGYIPWDDDIDVGMLREDYDKFSEAFNKANEKYKFVCYENRKDFYLPHGKVCDSSTVLYEPDENGYKLSVNIDIFVYDNAPDDDEELKKMYDERDSLRRIHSIQNQKVKRRGSAVNNMLRVVRRTFYRVFYSKNSIEKMIANSKKYANATTSRVGNFTSFSRIACDKRVFNDFIDLPFEGKTFKAPAGYDEWLKCFYGNYMQLPPIEKRVSHHLFKAFFCEE